MGNQSSQPTQQAERTPITDMIQGGYGTENGPKTPTRPAASAFFDPRSPSAPRTPVSSDAPAFDPRSPMVSKRTPLRNIDNTTEAVASKRGGKPKQFSVSVSSGASAATEQIV
jgi:hypothetical protein